MCGQLAVELAADTEVRLASLDVGLNEVAAPKLRHGLPAVWFFPKNGTRLAMAKRHKGVHDESAIRDFLSSQRTRRPLSAS